MRSLFHQIRNWSLLLGLVHASAWAQPTITSFSPAGGAVGTIVTVRGSGFGTSIAAADIVVTVGNASGNGVILTNTDTELTFMVSTRSSTGKITVSRPALGTSVESATNYELEPETDLPDTTNVSGISFITNPSPVPNNRFGSATDINANGSLFILGSPGSNGEIGEAFVYAVENNCGLRLLQRLSESSLTGITNYGRDVAISANGDVVAVGGPRFDSDRGRVWVYRRVPGTETWQLEATFTGISAGDAFGSSLDLSATGNTLAIGAPNAFGRTGAAYSYRFSSGSWSLLNEIIKASGSNTNFGTDVALASDGSTLAVGAPGASLGGQSIGAVWVFNRVAGGVTWDTVSTAARRVDPVGFTVDALFPNVQFGSAVSLSIRGNNLVVGAPGDNGGFGAGFVFTRDVATNNWTQQGTKLSTPTTLGGRQGMGNAVDITADGNALIIGGFIPGAAGNGYGWIYRRRDQNWSIFSTLQHPNGPQSAYGRDVSLSTRGSLAIVTGPELSANTGFAAMYRPRLRIDRVLPTEAAVGSNVTITGSGFLQGVTEVLVNGISIPASNYVILSSRTILLTVPDTPLGQGPITVRTNCAPFQQVVSAESFRQRLPPVVSSVEPASGPIGTEVTIRGFNFDPTPGNTTVRIGSAEALILEIQGETVIRARVSELNNGTIQVTTPFGTSTSTVSFELLLAPVISNFSPSSAFTGDIVTIQGQNFRPTTSVQFGSTPARSVEFVSASQLRAIVDTVPRNPPTVSIRVSETGVGQNLSTTPLTYAIPVPTFSSTPTSAPSAPVGSTLRIFGQNLRYEPIVRFNGASDITPVVRLGVLTGTTFAADTLEVVVPDNARTGNLTVLTRGGSNFIANYPVIPRPVVSQILVNGTPGNVAGEADTLGLSGTDLGSVTQVVVSGIPLPIASRTSTLIKIRIPNLVPGASTVVDLGAISLQWAGATPVVTSNLSFDAGPARNVSGPSSIIPYQWVTITGQNLGGTRQVTFGAFASDSIQIRSGVVIRARAPRQATSGVICVTNRAGQQVCAGSTFTTNTTEPLVLQSITPNRLSNNLIATITGRNLGLVDAVFFGGVAPQRIIRLSNDSLQAIVGTGAAGAVSFRRLGSSVTENSSLTVTYGPPMTFTTWTPVNSATQFVEAGQGDELFLFGSNFGLNPVVTVGGLPVEYAIYWSVASVRIKLDTGATGPIVLRTNNGVISSPRDFVFVPKPPVLSNTHVSTASEGETITLTGNFLQRIQSVQFDGLPASIQSVRDNNITVIVPNRQGRFSGFISVRNPSGTSTSNRLFTWRLPAPTITNVPATGIEGSTIRIVGTNFISSPTVPVRVTFGTVVATQFQVISEGLIEAVVPPNSGNTITVEAGGGSVTTGAGQYRFIPLPRITSVEPSEGAPGEPIVINGSALTNASFILIGGSPMLNPVISPDGTRITGHIGYGNSGSVTVTTEGGTATAPQQFRHFFRRPIVQSLSSNFGVQGSEIVITGRRFYGTDAQGTGLSVSFGGTFATILQVIDSTRIRVRLGNGANGRVVVRTADSSSAQDITFRFYRQPTIIDVTPKITGPDTPIEIGGTNLESDAIQEIQVFGRTIQQGNYSTNSSGNIIRTRVPTNASATAIPVRIITRGGEAQFQTLEFIPAPTITSVTPVEVEPGDEITIGGTNFIPRDSVKILFNNSLQRLATGAWVDATTVRFTIPEDSPASNSATVIVVTPSGSSDPSPTFRIKGNTVRPTANLSERLRVLPVPVEADGIVTLEGNVVVRAQSLQITIHDINGKTLLLRNLQLNDPRFAKGDINEKFDLSSYPPGVYFLQVVSGRQYAAWRLVKP